VATLRIVVAAAGAELSEPVEITISVDVRSAE
jgi:hypothetical protein